MPMNLMLRILAVLRGGKSQYLIIVKPIHQQKKQKKYNFTNKNIHQSNYAVQEVTTICNELRLKSVDSTDNI